MMWTLTAPEPADGPLTGSDRPMLEAYLDWQRATLLNICAGLTADQLAARPIPSSNLSLLGLLRHLAKVERTWFRERIAGEELPPLYDARLGKDADFDDIDASDAERAAERFQEACAASVEILAAHAFEDEITVHGEAMSVRMVVLHMIGEYSRHNGHADILREAIDGVTAR